LLGSKNTRNVMKVLFLVLASIVLASATVYFKEEFDAGWEDRWVHSTADDAAGTAGKFVATPGKYYGDAKLDSGVQTNPDARFFKYSAKFPKFSNKDKTLVLQYTVKHEQDLDCGGSYIKLAPPGLDQATFTGDSKYNIMFGPDQCGSSTKRVHFILNYKDKNHLIEKTISPVSDKLTHLYTAVIFPNQTYEVRIDGEVKESGSLLEDWSFLPPKEINDPEAKKPADWVDEREIPDPEAKKPEGWDDIPKETVDPEAKKPEDWDDELDGQWEPPTLPNPEYKGEWVPPMIPNPAFKGEWVHPKVPNPEYATDDSIYAFEHEFIAFEIWQVKTGTIFDHILVTDSLEEADAFVTGHFATQKKAEKEMFDKQEEERQEKEKLEREAEKKKLEEEEAKGGEEEEEDEEDDDEDKKEEDKKEHDEL